MGVGQNYVLDKGHLATGATAYAVGEIVTPIAGSGTLSTVLNSIQRATAANANIQYVVMEDLDTTRLATGKAVLDCRLMGIARVLTGAAVTKGTRVGNDTTARAVTVAQAGAGVVPKVVLGIALTDATAAGQFIDVLLTPGATF